MSAEHPAHPAHPDRHQWKRGGTTGRLGSGILSQPIAAPRSSKPSAETGDLDDLSAFADLAPTEPQLPSIPRLQRTAPRTSERTPDQRRLRIGVAFSEFMLEQDWIHDAALTDIPLQRRMRLFSKLAPTYLQVVQATGRMKLPGL